MGKILLMNSFALTEAVIGFEETFYSFSEDDGGAVVHVALLSGAVTSDAVVTVVTHDDKAVGRPLNMNPLYISNWCLCT